MKAKEFLSQIRNLDRDIQNKLDEINVLKDRMTNISVAFTGEEVVQHSRNVHALEKAIAKMIDLQDEITCDVGELVAKKTEIFNVINKIEDSEMVRLLYLRYFRYYTWEKVAVEMNMSIRNVYRLHGKALLEVQRINSEECSQDFNINNQVL